MTQVGDPNIWRPVEVLYFTNRFSARVPFTALLSSTLRLKQININIYACLALTHWLYDIDTAGVIAAFSAQVVFGGTLLGYLMGKISSAWLAKIFNDAVAETIITIAVPYITYFMGMQIPYGVM